MKTNVIVGIVVVVAIAVGAYFFWPTGTSIDNQATYPTGESPTEGDLSASSGLSGKKMAFSDFMKQGGSYKCTVNWNAQGIDTQGTTYMSGGMLRNEASTKAGGFTVDTTIIVRDGYSYTWSSMMPTSGFKSKVNTSGAMEDGTTGTSGQFTFNAEQVGDYNCEPWTPDNSKFELPKGVTFKEM